MTPRCVGPGDECAFYAIGASVRMCLIRMRRDQFVKDIYIEDVIPPAWCPLLRDPGQCDRCTPVVSGASSGGPNGAERVYAHAPGCPIGDEIRRQEARI